MKIIRFVNRLSTSHVMSYKCSNNCRKYSIDLYCVDICRTFCDQKVHKNDNFVAKRRSEVRPGMTPLRPLATSYAWIESIARKPKYVIEYWIECSLKTCVMFYRELIEWFAVTPPHTRKVMYLSAILVYLVKPMAVICLLVLVYVLANRDENPLTGRQTVINIPKGLPFLH